MLKITQQTDVVDGAEAGAMTVAVSRNTPPPQQQLHTRLNDSHLQYQVWNDSVCTDKHSLVTKRHYRKWKPCCVGTPSSQGFPVY